jgi:hypothetical protein
MVTLPNVALALSLLSFATILFWYCYSSIRLLKRMDLEKEKKTMQRSSRFIQGMNHPKNYKRYVS